MKFAAVVVFPAGSLLPHASDKMTWCSPDFRSHSFS